MSLYRDLLYSAIGSTTAEIITYPLCTLKTLHQNVHTKEKHIMSTFQKMLKERGFRGLWQGAMYGASSCLVGATLKYSLYRDFCRYFDETYEDQSKTTKVSTRIISGIGSGFISSIISHPFEVIKIHKQENISFRDVFRKYGHTMLYSGFSKSTTKIFLGSMVSYPLFDFTNSIISNTFIASIITATLYTCAIHPIDYMKTRQMSNKVWFHGCNIKPYYRGLILNLMRIVPHFTIFMCVVDCLKN